MSAVVLCDKEYPRRVAFTLLGKVIDEFTKENNENIWKSTNTELPCSFVQKAVDEYQDPAKADSIVRIQKDLDETKIILVSDTSCDRKYFLFIMTSTKL